MGLWGHRRAAERDDEREVVGDAFRLEIHEHGKALGHGIAVDAEP
jgi:hypothetical protein